MSTCDEQDIRFKAQLVTAFTFNGKTLLSKKVVKPFNLDQLQRLANFECFE